MTEVIKNHQPEKEKNDRQPNQTLEPTRLLPRGYSQSVFGCLHSESRVAHLLR
jgi:hypothetical protein